MHERLPDDGMAGALLGDPAVYRGARVDEVVSEAVVRDGMLARVVPGDVLPPGEPFDELSHDAAWFENRVQASATDESSGQVPGPDAGIGPDLVLAPDPGPCPEWPPDAVPVFMWPEEVLRLALRDAPGPRLARVVAETIDLAGNLSDDNGDRDLADGVDDDGAGPLGELSDDTLGDLVTACGRLQSWAAGVQARIVAERAARESHPLAHNSLVGQVTNELVVTEPEVVEVVVRAESGTQHPTVIQALITGRIDVRKAHTLLRSATQLTVAERAEAISRYLPHAPRRTWKWLQRKMLAFAKNLHGAAAAAKAAAQRRSVQIDRAEDDMGWLTAYLPAPDAAAVWGVVDDMAHQLRHATGEDRTLGQLRADSLTGIITGRLLPADRFTEPCTDTNGNSDRAEQDSREPDSTERDSTEPDGTEPDGTDVPVCTCGGRAPVTVTQEVVRPVRITPTRPVVRVTIPASALLNLDDAPGHLAGYGPIPAETARIIAQDATWQRLLTDPVTGILTDYSTTTYQPGKVLRAAIEARDDTCTFDWCDVPASRCDLDHIEPFDHDHKNDQGTITNENRSKGAGQGQTRAHNLHALCRKHHLLKTHAGWGIVRDPETGITTWITPTGRTHTRPPTVLDTHIEIEEIDPDTSSDLTLRALTGQALPRQYTTTDPGAVPTKPTDPTDPTSPVDPDGPPF